MIYVVKWTFSRHFFLKTIHLTVSMKAQAFVDFDSTKVVPFDGNLRKNHKSQKLMSADFQLQMSAEKCI